VNPRIAISMVKIDARYHEIEEQLGSEKVLANPSVLTALARERSELAPKVELYHRQQELSHQFEEAENMLRQETDPEMIALARAEAGHLEKELESLEERLKIMLLPGDPLDEKNIVMEIRAGTGGGEAALFAGDLYRMYTHYADKKGWKVEQLSCSTTESGGFKEMVFSIAGQDVYSHLKYESGVHRVQRVPATESQGRIHTSAASVVVMPEPEGINIDVNAHDLKIDVFRSSGPGGQSVNTTDSAVRVTHLPTGLVVSCQDEKSQLKNKQKAMKVLMARLYDRANQEQANSRSQLRRTMVGSGDRSAKIRTYNFPQNRVTDHRINLTMHKLDSIMEGDMDEIIDALRVEDQKQALESQEKESVA
jgi:peptide chain release factor 1